MESFSFQIIYTEVAEYNINRECAAYTHRGDYFAPAEAPAAANLVMPIVVVIIVYYYFIIVRMDGWRLYIKKKRQCMRRWEYGKVIQVALMLFFASSRVFRRYILIFIGVFLFFDPTFILMIAITRLLFSRKILQ